MEPEFIVADEPISALDMSIRAQVLNLLRRLQKERGITYLFIAHDLSVMRYISDRIAVIHKGRIVELAGAEELTAHAIHPYTRSLLSAIPMPDPRRERQKKLLVYDPAMHDYSREAPSGANCGLSILYCAALPKPSSGCRADPRHFGLNRCFTALLRNVHSLFLDILRQLHYNRICIIDSDF